MVVYYIIFILQKLHIWASPYVELCIYQYICA